MKKSGQKRNNLQLKRGAQTKRERVVRFIHWCSNDGAITLLPIASPVVIIDCSFVCHATFLHYASGSGILSFTFGSPSFKGMDELVRGEKRGKERERLVLR